MLSSAWYPNLVLHVRKSSIRVVLTGFVFLGNGEGAGSAEHHQIQQGVGTQSVSTMDAGTGCLATGIQARDHLVLPVSMRNYLMGKQSVCHSCSGAQWSTSHQESRCVCAVAIHNLPVPCSLWVLHPYYNEQWAGQGWALWWHQLQQRSWLSLRYQEALWPAAVEAGGEAAGTRGPSLGRHLWTNKDRKGLKLTAALCSVDFPGPNSCAQQHLPDMPKYPVHTCPLGSL